MKAVLYWGIEVGEMADPPAWLADRSWKSFYAHSNARKTEETVTLSNEEIAAHVDVIACHVGFSVGKPYVAVNQSTMYAVPGQHPVVHGLYPAVDWQGKLYSFCQKLGLPWKEPRWHIAIADDEEIV